MFITIKYIYKFTSKSSSQFQDYDLQSLTIAVIATSRLLREFEGTLITNLSLQDPISTRLLCVFDYDSKWLPPCIGHVDFGSDCSNI